MRIFAADPVHFASQLRFSTLLRRFWWLLLLLNMALHVAYHASCAGIATVGRASLLIGAGSYFPAAAP